MTTNWNNASEARVALERGELPEGYTVDADGALHLPRSIGVANVRGPSIIMAHFSKIVSFNGDVLKCKEGDRL